MRGLLRRVRVARSRRIPTARPARGGGGVTRRRTHRRAERHGQR